MPTTYSVSRNIRAPRGEVWKLLTDAERYEDWNSAVLSLRGPIALGNKIELVSIVNPKRTFKLAVTEMDEPSKMVWSDGMPLGLFQGVRTYTLAEGADGTTDFRMEEVFSGLLEPLISKSIPDMTESFEQFGDSLKAAAERAAGG